MDFHIPLFNIHSSGHTKARTCKYVLYSNHFNSEFFLSFFLSAAGINNKTTTVFSLCEFWITTLLALTFIFRGQQAVRIALFLTATNSNIIHSSNWPAMIIKKLNALTKYFYRIFISKLYPFYAFINLSFLIACVSFFLFSRKIRDFSRMRRITIKTKLFKQ